MKTWCRVRRSLLRITQIHTDIGCAGEAKNNSEIKIPNPSVVPPKTIFAFLMLNTMSPAHNKIFGAKFLSFERARINGLYTVN